MRLPEPRCCGQFLLSAGAKGKRFALPHARILMHRGSAGIGGSAVDIEVQADDLRHTVDTVLGLIAQDTGQPVEAIFEDSKHDHWYTAEQSSPSIRAASGSWTCTRTC
jgi:ATP-dependent Clp protease protease subunit